MGTIDVGIRHDDNLVVSPFRNVLFHSDTRPNRLNHAADFFIGENFIFARLVGVDDFTTKWQDRLIFPQASTFGASTGRITFHQVQLAFLHVLADTISQFPGQAAAGKRSFSFSQQRFGLAGRFTRLGGQNPFANNRLGRSRVLL